MGAIGALLAAACFGNGHAADTHVESDASIDAGVDSQAAPPPPCTVTAPTSCTEPAPHYAEIATIIESRCGAPCHTGAPNGPWPLREYEHVADWADQIRDEIVHCTMPPLDAGFVMPGDEKEKVLEWIRCGAPP